MVARHAEEGFTIVEMIVTLVVMSVFLTMALQAYLAANAQQVSIVRFAAAYDIVKANLGKIATRADIPTGTEVCQTEHDPDGLPNNNNQLINPDAPGSTIELHDIESTEPGINAASTADTPLANMPLDQTLKVLYPQGCDGDAPAKIVSEVTYGSEVVSSAKFVK